MSTPNQPLRLDQSELFSPAVEEYLEQRAALQRGVPDFDPQPLWKRILFANYVYLSLACGAGALVGWMIIEPFFNDNDLNEGAHLATALLMFPAIASFIGLFLGAAEGIMCRNPLRAVISAAVGVGVGFVGAVIVTIPAGIVFGLMSAVALQFAGDLQPGQMPTGFALLFLMMGRAVAWAIFGIPAGLGQGIAIRESKVVLNGVLGGLLGGLAGGLLFDPISLVLMTADGQAAASRCVGFVVIGLMVGFFVGLVEQWTKTAWLLMRAGPLAGKQFVLYKNPTVLGSSPKADVYLFKDDAIEPRHALIHNRGGRFEIEDCNTPDGTYVNGIPIKSQFLLAGDQIVLGKTVLEFELKEAR